MIFNLIQRRTSVRTFRQEHLSKDDKAWISSILEEISNEAGPNGTSVNFRLLSPDPGEDGSIAGTYGFIRNAQAYIAGCTTSEKADIEDYGYLLEKVIVRLVERDIGSCWLGGTFKRDDFNGPIAVKIGQLIPAVIPVGYPVKNRRTAEKAMRFMIKADKRRKWADLFYINNFENSLANSDLDGADSILLSAFEGVRLGPSASNKQPWRLVYMPDSKCVHFYLNEDPGYSGNKLGFSMQRLDAGIAMYHFESVAAENDITGSWSYSDPGLKPPDKNYCYIKTFSW